MTKYDEICADIDKISSDIKLEELQPKIESIGKECASIPEFCQDSVLTKLVTKFGKVVKKDVIKSQFKLALAPSAPKVSKAITQIPKAPKKQKNTSGFGHIKDCGAHYSVTDDDDNDNQLSTFTLKLNKLVVQSSGPDLLCCDVITWRGVEFENWVVPQKAWVSKRGFKENFPSTSMQWSGSEDDVQEIYAMCASARETVPKIRGTRTLGLQGEGNEKRWVSINGTMNALGWMKEPDLIYVADGGSTIQDKIDRERRDPEDSSSIELLKEVLRASFSLYAHEASVPIFAWFAASLHKAELIRKYGGFPLLDVYGKHGSGKTSLTSNIPWRTFHGITNYETLTATDSPFAFYRNIASTYSHALLYDEYKPAEMGTKIGNFNNIVRNIYTGSVSSRGRGDQSVTSYPSIAPFCVIGETKLGEDDPAIGERCVYAHTDKEWLLSNNDVHKKFTDLSAKPLHVCAPYLWKCAIITDVVQFFERAEALVAAVFKGMQIEPRIYKNMVILIIGILCLQDVADILHINLPPIDLKKILETQRLLALGVEDDEDWKDGDQRDALDVFLNDGATMADVGDIEPEIHYTWVGQDPELRLNVAAIEAARNQWYQKQGKASPSPGARALISIAKGRESGIRVCRVEFAGGGRPTCIGLDPAKFPVAGRYRIKKIRSHGGDRAEPKHEPTYVMDKTDGLLIHGPFDTPEIAKAFAKGKYGDDVRYCVIPASAAAGRKSKGELAEINNKLFS